MLVSLHPGSEFSFSARTHVSQVVTLLSRRPLERSSIHGVSKEGNVICIIQICEMSIAQRLWTVEATRSMIQSIALQNRAGARKQPSLICYLQDGMKHLPAGIVYTHGWFFSVFRPTGTYGPLLPTNFTLIGSVVWVYGPKLWKFRILPILLPLRGVSLARFL